MSQLITDDPTKALQFASMEAAANRGCLILELFPDLKVEALELPCHLKLISTPKWQTSTPSND
jgi:hypothetical protein